jgi:acyl-CoA reductase-like NAD-dependent aldehyde dehydrogenase
MTGVGPYDRGVLVDGQWLTDGPRQSVDNPATGEVVAFVNLARVEDVDRAAHIAAIAQRGWATTPPDRRSDILRRAATLIREGIEKIALALTLEQGKPLPDSRKEILFGAQVLDYYAEEGRRVTGSIRQSGSAGTMSLVTYSPVGVVAAIVPWNYPVDLYCWKVAPALAAGCAVLVKPPVETPIAIGMVAALILEAGVPPGVLADLPGGADIGQALVTHPDVTMVTATCSTATGQAIMRTAADGLKKVSLELGGHSPLVVLDDADIPFAAAAASRRSFSNMGQICIAVNRVIVDDRVADDFVEALRQEADSIELGDPAQPGVLYGPTTTAAVIERARHHIDDALARGGRLVAGGKSPEGAQWDKGHFFRPTVVDNVRAGSKILREETFGPVLGVRRVSDLAAAVDAANDSAFGLAAYVYGQDLDRAWAVAERIDAGGVGVNVNDVSELQAPFGGWKLSGIGSELGPEGLHAYLRPKHIKLRRRR